MKISCLIMIAFVVSSCATGYLKSWEKVDDKKIGLFVYKNGWRKERGMRHLKASIEDFCGSDYEIIGQSSDSNSVITGIDQYGNAHYSTTYFTYYKVLCQ